MLEGERDLLPRPRFYSRCPETSTISLEYVEFILRHLVQQRNQELEQEKLEQERRKVKEDSLNYQLTLEISQRGLSQLTL